MLRRLRVLAERRPKLLLDHVSHDLRGVHELLVHREAASCVVRDRPTLLVEEKLAVNKTFKESSWVKQLQTQMPNC